MIRQYKINKHNSMVNGYPGREFDWSLFCWDGSGEKTDYCYHTGCNHKHISKSPSPWVDGKGYLAEYLHVPFEWNHMGTIFRVYPNESLQPGEIYRGHLVKSVKAIKKDDGCYWELEDDNGV